MNYQSSSDEETPKGGMDRPSDQASRMPMDFQMAGADSVDLGTRAVRPPFSNPPNSEMQLGGADEVQEILGADKRNDFAWETQVGGGRKAPQTTD